MPSTQKKIRDLERLLKRKARQEEAKVESTTKDHGESTELGPRAQAAKLRAEEGLHQTITQLKEDREVRPIVRSSFCFNSPLTTSYPP